MFGTTKHLENAEHPKGKRPRLMPHDATLKVHNPKLFVALDLAKSQSVSDKTLCRELLLFIREDVNKDSGRGTDGLQDRRQPNTTAGKRQQEGSRS